MEEKDCLLGPFTLEEAKEWLFRLEDIATIERDVAFGIRFALLNLFGALSASGLIDGTAFIATLRAHLPAIGQANLRLGAECVLADWERALRAPPGTVLH